MSMCVCVCGNVAMRRCAEPWYFRIAITISFKLLLTAKWCVFCVCVRFARSTCIIMQAANTYTNNLPSKWISKWYSTQIWLLWTKRVCIEATDADLKLNTFEWYVRLKDCAKIAATTHMMLMLWYHCNQNGIANGHIHPRWRLDEHLHTHTNIYTSNGLDNVHVTFIKQMITRSAGCVSDAFYFFLFVFFDIKHIILRQTKRTSLEWFIACKDDANCIFRYISINLPSSVEMVGPDLVYFWQWWWWWHWSQNNSVISCSFAHAK